MERLDLLETDSVKLITSILQICHRPIQMWSTGKDSTLSLYLVRKAFGRFPWPVIHIDTGRKPAGVYHFRQYLTDLWQIPLTIISNKEALELGLGPENLSKFECCTQLKTNTLKDFIRKKGYDGIIMSIRHDEHYVRGMEDLVSLRDGEGNWRYWARYGGFGLTAPEKLTGAPNEDLSHIRIHPLLPWTEAEVWQYTMKQHIPVNGLYFSTGGTRYRSLGCECCTDTVKSRATTIEEIVEEVYMTPGLERSGRLQDKENSDTMLRLRNLGYM